MKITLPLYNQAVRGILPNVGTFTQTPWGAVLRRTRTTQPPPTPTTARNRWRFAVEVYRHTTGLTNNAQPLALTLSERLPALDQSAPPSHARHLSITTPSTASNLGIISLSRTNPGEPRP